jgi:hypothetical protein
MDPRDVAEGKAELDDRKTRMMAELDERSDRREDQLMAAWADAKRVGMFPSSLCTVRSDVALTGILQWMPRKRVYKRRMIACFNWKMIPWQQPGHA